jgi:sugar lactone lactonase YvrE
VRARVCRALAAACCVGAIIATFASAAVAAAPPGTVTVFAQVGRPGFPALPHVVGQNVFEGTYDNPSGDDNPSQVFEYSSTGSLVTSWTVLGQDLSKPHGVQVAANDSKGRLVLLDKTSGRIILLDPATSTQKLYSQVPDLPLCSSVSSGTPCSPALVDQTPMPDYAAWGPDGSLYVTDYQQAVIWRIPPGGGKPAIWLADPRLDGGPFGTACVAMLPDHHTLLFDQASNGGLGGSDPANGKLYKVAIEPSGKPGPLQQIWASGPADAPDGCALSAAGNIYIALVGASNQVVELGPAGHEIARFGTAYTGDNGSPVPFDSPSGLAFFGTRLLIANQSYFADNASNQVLLALETGEQGAPVYVPAGAGLPPASGHRKHHRHRRKHHRRRNHHGRKHKRHQKPARHRHHRSEHGRHGRLGKR